MRFVFDHLVHFVEEPKEVIAQQEANGIHTVEGGAHQNRGTFNTLSYFGLSYIEYLGTYDRNSVEQTKHPRHSLIETIVNDQFTEGFSRFAVRTTDIEGVARHFREKGLTVNGPNPYSRKRPDGSVIDWQLSYAGEENDELQLPFIIQWDEGDDDRQADLTERGVIGQQPDGLSFTSVTFAVRDAHATAEKWSDLLQLKELGRYEDDELNATCVELELPGGNLVFASPKGNGVVAQFLETRGERPIRANFSGGKQHQSYELFKGLYKINQA